MSKGGKHDGKSFQDKLKSFFKSNAKGFITETGDGRVVLSPDLITAISAPTDTESRMRTIKELAKPLREQRLEDQGVELLWIKTRDLLENGDDAQREEMFNFFGAVVKGQYERIDVARGHFFRLIKHKKGDSETDPDLKSKIRMLDALTNCGKDIKHFEEDVGKLLQNFFPQVIRICLDDKEISTIFLTLLVNTIKFNASLIREATITSYVHQMSHICLVTTDYDHIKLCLASLDAILCYCFIPKDAFRTYVYILCILVNLKFHTQEVWRITKNLMGTDMGHTALYTMCQVIQLESDVALVRGAVFFVGTALWGCDKERVKRLEAYSSVTILSTFREACVANNHHLVLFEVTIQTERLVTRYGSSLRALRCDAVLSLVETLLDLVPINENKIEVDLKIMPHLQSIITHLEGLSAMKRYVGSKHRLYNAIDKCASLRPENSVISLIEYRATEIYPTKIGWLASLQELVSKHYCQETRSEVRLKTLEVLMGIFRSNRQMYEEDMLDSVILPLFSNVDQEKNENLRLEVVKLLANVGMESYSKKAASIFDILEKVVVSPSPSETKEDLAAVIFGLINIIRHRLCQQPAFVIVRSCDIIVKHLETSYQNPQVFKGTGKIREEIFRLFMKMRANEKFQLGMEIGDKVEFSSYLACQEPGASESSSSSVVDEKSGMTYMSLTKSCVMVIRCLREERDWQVLKLVLSQVPGVLENKAMLGRYGTNLQEFVHALTDLTKVGGSYPDCLVNTGGKLARTEFHNHVYPVLAAMAPYNEYLDVHTARPLVNALQNGLLSRECNKICIVALTACALEMKKSMHSFISNLLLNLSKISPTKAIATPMLEFLSTLIRLPDLFANFIDTHYMSVFAISIPFTNPLRFDAYTVALAHHVIVMWFLKCRLIFRQNFVQFIISGLNNNVLYTIDDTAEFRKPAATLSAKGSNVALAASKAAAGVGLASGDKDHISRQRSSSFSSHSSTVTGSHQPQDVQQQKTSKWVLFHRELSETCVDFLSRYMFANAAVLPRRLPTAEFLLKGGQSASWIVGNMIITITTSICDQTTTRSNGLCDRCHFICFDKSGNPQVGESKKDEDADDAGRRRHASDVHGFAASTSPSKKLLHTDLSRRSSVGRVSLKDLQEEVSGDASGMERLMKKHRIVEKRHPVVCGCWCTGWAEIHVRRPSGDTSWMCRIQNSSLVSESHKELTASDLTTLFYPSKESQAVPGQNVKPKTDKNDEENDIIEEEPKVKLDRRPSAVEGATASLPGIRDRAHTVSGHLSPRKNMSRLQVRPTSHGGSGTSTPTGNPQFINTDQNLERVTGVSPQFVFLTLFHSGAFGQDVRKLDNASLDTRPLLIPHSRSVELSIRSLDRIHPHETHKIGIIYIGPGQPFDEEVVLANPFGSLRYADFLHGIGTLTPLKGCDEKVTFLGGLSADDGDGDFTYLWEDDVMQVVFHVATMMPNRQSDPKCHKKKRHIGNNFVTIVYNNVGDGRYGSDKNYEFNMIKGQFNYAAVVITPLDQGSNRVEIKCRPELNEPLGHVKEPKAVSDKNLGILVRQMALHCNLAAQIQQSLGSNRDPYASNWLERLRAIKRVRSKVTKELEASLDDRERGSSRPASNDFTIAVLQRKDADI